MPEPDYYYGTTVSSLCSMLPSSVLMTGVLRDILSRHFFEAERIEDPDLRHLIWREGIQTGILIESAHRWIATNVEQAPAIVVKRNSSARMFRGIGDRRQGQPVDRDGFPHYLGLWVGSHTLFCIGQNGAQSELLAWETARHIGWFAPIIRQSLNLKRIQVTQVGATAILEENQQNFVTPVTVGYGYEDAWVIHSKAPRLRAISASLLCDC
jgi:hypothetical protein